MSDLTLQIISLALTAAMAGLMALQAWLHARRVRDALVRYPDVFERHGLPSPVSEDGQDFLFVRAEIGDSRVLLWVDGARIKCLLKYELCVEEGDEPLAEFRSDFGAEF